MVVLARKPRRNPVAKKGGGVLNAADFYKQNELEPYIETVRGERFYIYRPEFDIEDIAPAIAKQCRFTGHVKRFYSVAEHSVLVMKLMRDLGLGNPFEGLMHDATEAYLSDIAAPWKALLPDYKKLEAMLEGPLRKHWGLPPTITAGCKKADWLALFIEAHSLMPTKAKEWIAPEGIKEEAYELAKDIARYPVVGWYDVPAEKLFREAYMSLTGAP